MGYNTASHKQWAWCNIARLHVRLKIRSAKILEERTYVAYVAILEDIIRYLTHTLSETQYHTDGLGTRLGIHSPIPSVRPSTILMVWERDLEYTYTNQRVMYYTDASQEKSFRRISI